MKTFEKQKLQQKQNQIRKSELKKKIKIKEKTILLLQNSKNELKVKNKSVMTLVEDYFIEIGSILNEFL